MSKKVTEQAQEVGKTIKLNQGEEVIKFGGNDTKLVEVINNFDKIIDDLKKAINKDPINQALLNAIKDFTNISEALKSHTNNVNSNINEIISSPIKNLAEHLEKGTPLSELQKFVTDQAEKAKEKLHENVGGNKILKAAWGVVFAVCEVINVTVSGVINSAIANGKLATSVKDFGAAISNSFQKSPKTNAREF